MAFPASVSSEDDTALAFRGTAPVGTFIVVSFDIERQGFPKGSRGYDGTFAGGGTVIHLSRSVAEAVFKLAEPSTVTP
jgi:hypothetical protein